MTPRRLQVLLAEAGWGSRRSAERLIRAGRVRVNGAAAVIGQQATPDDVITVDGQALPPRPQPVCYAMNKPVGVVTTMRDPQGRPCVADYLGEVGQRVFPVGRLDRDSEGLLLLTNDGALANLLLHPRHHVRKTYVATLHLPVGEEFAAALRRGVPLADGPLAVLRAELLGPDRVLVEIAEGRRRVVRRALLALGRRTTRLQRIRVGSVSLGDLPPGGLRRLSQAELRRLEQAAAAGEGWRGGSAGPRTGGGCAASAARDESGS